MKTPKMTLPASFSGLKRPCRIAFFISIFVALALLFVHDRYTSEARLLPVTTSPLGSMSQLADAASAFGINVPGKTDAGSNLDDILQSRWMMESLLKTSFKFHMKTWRFGRDKEFEKTLYDYLVVENMDRGVQRMADILMVNVDKKSGLLTIMAETKSPDLSQQIVQKAISLLETFVQTSGRTRGGFKAAFAEERLAEARTSLDQAEARFREFLEVNHNYQSSSDPHVRLRGARLETEYRLQQQLVTTLVMNREQALMEEKNDMPILNVMDPGNLPIDKSKPKRGVMVILAFMVVAGSVWAWDNREWIKSKVSS